MVESRPNRCNLLRPKQKCSIMWKISTGFSTFPISGSSVMIKSISTFAWMKSPSVLLRTVPLIPIRQCSWRECVVYTTIYNLNRFNFNVSCIDEPGKMCIYRLSSCVSILYLGPLEYCFWVQCLSLARVILVGLDPTDILTPPKAPLPQTLKWVW